MITLRCYHHKLLHDLFLSVLGKVRWLWGQSMVHYYRHLTPPNKKLSSLSLMLRSCLFFTGTIKNTDRIGMHNSASSRRPLPHANPKTTQIAWKCKTYNNKQGNKNPAQAYYMIYTFHYTLWNCIHINMPYMRAWCRAKEHPPQRIKSRCVPGLTK